MVADKRRNREITRDSAVIVAIVVKDKLVDSSNIAYIVDIADISDTVGIVNSSADRESLGVETEKIGAIHFNSDRIQEQRREVGEIW